MIIKCCLEKDYYTQIAKTLGSKSTRYRSDTKVSDRYLIDIDSIVFAIWAVSVYELMSSQITSKSTVCSTVYSG